MFDLRYKHWKIVKYILKYMQGTLDMELEYGISMKNLDVVCGYFDRNYVGDLDKRKS